MELHKIEENSSLEVYRDNITTVAATLNNAALNYWNQMGYTSSAPQILDAEAGDRNVDNESLAAFLDAFKKEERLQKTEPSLLKAEYSADTGKSVAETIRASAEHLLAAEVTADVIASGEEPLTAQNRAVLNENTALAHQGAEQAINTR